MTLGASKNEALWSSLSSSCSVEKNESQRKWKFTQSVFSNCFSTGSEVSLIKTPYAVGNVRGKPKSCREGLFPTSAGRKTGWQFLGGARHLCVLQPSNCTELSGAHKPPVPLVSGLGCCLDLQKYLPLLVLFESIILHIYSMQDMIELCFRRIWRFLLLLKKIKSNLYS